MSKKIGDHVLFVPGAGEEVVVGHVIFNHGDSTLDIQTRDGVERRIPHREQTSEGEDLGRTWHDV